MEARPLALLLLSLIALFVGFLYSYFNPVGETLSSYPLTFLVLLFFLAGIVFFGYLAFIPSALYGLSMGSAKNPVIFINLLPIVLAIYSGIVIGSALQDDLQLKRNYKIVAKRAIILFAIAIILALIIEFGAPLVIHSIPNEIFNDVNTGDSTLSILDKGLGMITK